jgi:SAM-dependent methyltransferase
LPLSEKPAYYRGRRLDAALMARYLRLLDQRYPLLELGCGNVTLAHESAVRGMVIGLDNDLSALRSRNAPGAAVDLETNVLPLRSGAVGSVLAKDILEHVQKPWLLLHEVHRVMRPGGKILVSVPMALGSRVWEDYTHVRGFTRNALVAMLQDTGFRVLRTGIMGGIPLTGKLGLADYIPAMMLLPPVRWAWGRSHEAVAERM